MFRTRQAAPDQPGLRGVWAAAVTPHREAYEADFAGMLELVDRLSHSGIDGIVLMGATGEFLNFKKDDRERLVHLAVKRSSVPIIAGVSYSTLDATVQLAGAAIDSGCAGLLLMPPYFYRYSDAEILEFYGAFAKAASGALPVLLYNLPQFTNTITIEMARELLGAGFAGIKDSSGDPKFLEALAHLRQEQPFTLFCGNDRLIVEAQHLGCDGVISGVACAVPELIVAIHSAAHSGDLKLLEELQQHLFQFIDWIDQFPVPVGIAAATIARGSKVGPPAVPLTAAQAVALDHFRDWFAEWLPVIQKLTHARPIL